MVDRIAAQLDSPLVAAACALTAARSRLKELSSRMDASALAEKGLRPTSRRRAAGPAHDGLDTIGLDRPVTRPKLDSARLEIIVHPTPTGWCANSRPAVVG